MSTPTVYADFNNADPLGRLRLNCVGMARDPAALGVQLRDGMLLRLHDEELEADGHALYSSDERNWVAAIDWQRFRPRSATSP